MSCAAGHDWEIITEAVSALPVRIMCGECGKSGAVSFAPGPRSHPYYTSASGTCSYCDGDIADPWHTNRRNLRMRYQVIVTIEDEDDKVFTFETDHAILGSSVEELPPDE